MPPQTHKVHLNKISEQSMPFPQLEEAFVLPRFTVAKGVVATMYAILRFEKRKGSSGQTGGIEKHHERKKDTYISNPDIDTSRSHLNYHLCKPAGKYSKEISCRIEAAGCRVRKDSVKFIDTIITASGEFLEKLSETEQQSYFKRAYDFIKQNIGEDNIFSAVVHVDEKTPHMHLCFTPITEDARLSAKEIIGNRSKLIEWQDNFHDYMGGYYPELQRGESASITERKHVPSWMFKQANKLTTEMETIQTEIKSIGVLNAKQQKEKLLELFSKWSTSVNSFEGYLRPFSDRIKDLEQSNAELKNQKDKSVHQSQQMGAEIFELKNQLEEWREFSGLIPDEVMTEVSYQQMRNKELEEEIIQNDFNMELE